VNQLTVLGEASAEVLPDRVVWTLTVHESDAKPRIAFERCATRLAALAEALAPADVATGSVEIAEEYDDQRGGSTGRVAASASLSATVGVDQGGRLATAAMDAGADELNGPLFQFPDSDETFDTLLADAVRAARRSGEGMAEAAGRRLGRVLTIDDRRTGEAEYRGPRLARRAGRPRNSPEAEELPVITRPRRMTAAVVVTFELTD
jgi:uncharacterized protein YggE